MARPGRERETIWPLAVDRDGRPDAADLVEARGRDVARFCPDDDDVVENDGLDDQGWAGRQLPDVRERARR